MYVEVSACRRGSCYEAEARFLGQLSPNESSRCLGPSFVENGFVTCTGHLSLNWALLLKGDSYVRAPPVCEEYRMCVARVTAIKCNQPGPPPWNACLQRACCGRDWCLCSSKVDSSPKRHPAPLHPNWSDMERESEVVPDLPCWGR